MRHSYKYLIFILVLLTGMVGKSFAQDFLPVLNDNYMGINQALLQPASIADSRFSSDFNVTGFSNDIYNDAMRFRSRWLMDPTGIVTNKNWWDENTYLKTANGKDKNMFMSQSLLGPGFMASIGTRYAIGFTSRVRSITNIDGIDEPLFRMMYSNYTDSAYWNRWFYDGDMRTVQHVFGDYGLTFAMVVMNKQKHFLKAGGTLKLLQGIASAYLQTDQLYYYFNGQEYPDAKPISLNSPYMHGGISDNWGDIEPNGNYSFSMNYQLTAKPSVGLDLGVVYEYRPKLEKDRYDISGRKDLNKYFVKVGISLLDIGRLKYKKDYYSSDLTVAFTPDYQNRYLSGDNSVPGNTYWMDANQVDFNYKTYVNFSDTMYRRSLAGLGVQKATGDKQEFKIKLPTAFSLQVDLNLFVEGLYVNLTTFTGLNRGYSHVPNSHYVSNYSITPRYERKWYGVSVPVQVNQYKKLEVGLGVRAGVVYFGVNNLFSNVFSDPYGIHGYVGVKVPIHYKDPTRPPKEKKDKKDRVVMCCPCCGCPHPAMDCLKCMKIACRDTAMFNKMECLPACIEITMTNPTIIINQGNSSPPQAAEPGAGSQQEPPATTEPAGSGAQGGSGTMSPPSNSEVYFDFDSYLIRPADNATLINFAKYLAANPAQKIKITGYTDSIDTDEYNIRLSKNRARAVYDYLIQQGILPEQLELDWKGETNPKGDNRTKEGRQKNRRVELKLL